MFEQGDHPRGVEASMSDEMAFANGNLCLNGTSIWLPPNAAITEPCDHAKTTASFLKILEPQYAMQSPKWSTVTTTGKDGDQMPLDDLRA